MNKKYTIEGSRIKSNLIEFKYLIINKLQTG